MVVAIAINITVGSITVALRLPIYLDSIGTVLVGALAGPWAGALTGILANLIWSILPIPGGAGPTIAFYAPVAGVIGLMAGFWASRGVFQLRSDDARVGGFLALAAGIVGAGVAFLLVQVDDRDPEPRRDRSRQAARQPGPVRDHRGGLPRGRRRGRLDRRTNGLRVQERRSADPDLPHRGDGDRGLRDRVRAAPPAVRPGRLLLGGRPGSRPTARP